jgi:membrane protease YdiL (CAAX protease family)
MTRTLSPELRAYALAALVLCSAACLTLAAHLHARWVHRYGIPFVAVHVAVMSAIAVGAVGVLGPSALSAGTPWAALMAVPVGVACAAGVIVVDSAIVRRLARPAAVRAGYPAAVDGPGTTAPRPAGLATASQSFRQRRIGLDRASNGFAPTAADLRVRLGWLLGVAALEEAVFRGVLLRLALLVPVAPLRWAAVLGTAAVFAFSHLFFGWTHVLAKAPLAVATTTTALVTGGIGAAVVTHTLFNGYVWRRARLASGGGA